MQRISFILRFLKYYFKAQTKYHIHSPFVYEFCEEVLDDNRSFYAFRDIEVLRKLLRTDKTEVQITDYGAGSLISNGKVRTVANIAKNSATYPTFCQIMFRLVHHFKPKTMLEMGTSLGISTLYQSRAALDAKLITMEGDPNVAALANRNFQRMKAKNITLLEGEFDQTMPMALKEFPKLDYVFFDGNHRKEPTIKYFHQCLENAHEDTVFVFDDNHWSEGMEAAWEEVKKHPRVMLTIDLFFCGIVFFRKEQRQKEHFTLIPSAWKPFGIGMRDLLRG